MNSKSALSGPLAVLILPRSPKDLIAYGMAVHDSMANNPLFPNPEPSLDVVKNNIDALVEAQTKATTKAVGAAAARDAKMKQVSQDLYHLCDYVQKIAEDAPDAATGCAVIKSAFMSVKKVPTRTKPELSAKSTGIPGQVVLTAKSVARTATYYWEHSPDQATWTSVPETMKASATVVDLPVAQTRYFRFRALTRAGKGDYSPVV